MFTEKEMVVEQIVERAVQSIYLQKKQLKNQINNLLNSIREREGTIEAYLLHLDKASVYYVNQCLGQVTIISDWVSKGYFPSEDAAVRQLEKLFSLCREYANERRMIIDCIDPLKNLREKQPMSDRISAFEDFYYFCFIRNEITMSLFSEIINKQTISKKLFGLLDNRFTVEYLQETLLQYIDGCANKINENL
jgi:hypothetical protein